jgi:hypothetical protein
MTRDAARASHQSERCRPAAESTVTNPTPRRCHPVGIVGDDAPARRSGRGAPYPASDKTASMGSLVMYDVVQIAGSLLILAAFVAALGGRTKQSSYVYLAANAIGSATLAGTAVIGREWGFILLEGVWALVSGYSIVRKAAGQSVAGSH